MSHVIARKSVRPHVTLVSTIGSAVVLLAPAISSPCLVAGSLLGAGHDVAALTQAAIFRGGRRRARLTALGIEQALEHRATPQALAATT